MSAAVLPADDATELQRLERELAAYIECYGAPGMMPSHIQLQRRGRGDLVAVITNAGGFAVVAERLNLTFVPRRPRGYWQDPANVDREVLAFAAQTDRPHIMPSGDVLVRAGRNDLALAVNRNGGTYAIAKRLGLRLSRPINRRNHWDDFDNLASELRAYLAEPGRPQRMPTYPELQAAGRFDLKYAIERNGGIYAVAERLGLPALPSSRRPKPLLTPEQAG